MHCGRLKLLSQLGDILEGETLRITCRKMGKPRLVHLTHNHRALQFDVDGYPARAVVVKTWRWRK
jgi:hypothetical protein